MVAGAARAAARRALECAYVGECSIYQYRGARDPDTGITREEEVCVAEGLPCRLSFERLSAAAQTETAAETAQGLKLFLAPDVRVSAGSKVVVTQNGATGEYSASGEPAVYPTHQEVVLELSRRRA